jgi:hypothetical protein
MSYSSHVFKRTMHPHKPLTIVCESFHIKSTQKRDISNLTSSELEWFFCEIVVRIEISIPAKFYCFMATRFLTADIQSSQKTHFFCTSCLRKSGITSAWIEIQSSFYAHLKANKNPFPMIYYTNIFSTVMYPRSSHSTFDLVFLKIRYYNFFEKNILCACNYYLKHLQISSWACNGFGVCGAFYCEEWLHLYWWGNFKQHVSLKFFTFINLGLHKLTMYRYWEILQFI